MDYRVGETPTWKDASEGQFVQFRNQLRVVSSGEHEGRWSLTRLGYVGGVMQACVTGPFNEDNTGRWVVVVPVPDRMAFDLPDLLAKYVLQQADFEAGYGE